MTIPHTKTYLVIMYFNLYVTTLFNSELAMVIKRGDAPGVILILCIMLMDTKKNCISKHHAVQCVYLIMETVKQYEK